MASVMQIFVLLAALVTAAQCFSKEHPAVDGNFPGRLRGGRNVVAVFDMGGVTGTIQFYQPRRGGPTTIHVNLDGLDQYQDTFGWHIHEFPVRFGTLRDYPCSQEQIGGHYDPLGAVEAAGGPDLYPAVCASDPTLCEVGDLAGRNGRLRIDQPWQIFEDPLLDLFGPYSPIGHSVLIHRGDATGERFICANVEYNGVRVDTFRAAINNGPLQGDVIIRRVVGVDDATIEVDVYRIDGMTGTTSHDWSLNFGQPDDSGCAGISNFVYGEQTHPEDEDAFINCGSQPQNQRLCPMGDLTAKCGELVIENGRGKVFCTDNQIGVIPLSLLNPLSLVIRDSDDPFEIISCAPLLPVEPECAVARFQNNRLFGDVFFYQATPYDRTFVRSFVTGLRRENPRFLIRENPIPDNRTCVGLGPIIRKPGPLAFGVPVTNSAFRTGDSVILGNLDPKVPIPLDAQSLRRVSSSSYLPLFGPYNIIGNSLSLERSINDPIACATIERFHPIPDDLVASILGFQEEA